MSSLRFLVRSEIISTVSTKNTLLNHRSVLSTPRLQQINKNMSTQSHVLTMENMNPNIRAMPYVVGGPLLIRAMEIEKELQKGISKPFNEMIKSNIGDCHAMGQVPITFFHQVLALATYPKLFEDPSFPEDAKQRAKSILSACAGRSVGSYSDPVGIEMIRRHVAEYIEERDGIPSDWENIALGAGATTVILNVLKLLICDVNGKKPGVMIPIPQYQLYAASLAEFNIHQIDYYLDESRDWSLSISELERAITEAKKVSTPRAIAIINPGNPTGQVLPRENIEEIIKFAYKEKLFILADEVYQYNIFAEGSQFHSFKKVMTEMGPPYSNMELASFMSCSKGYMGECGLRGGFAEVINMCPEVKTMYLKTIRSAPCSTILGQACIDLVVKPPKKGEPSYDLYIKEKTDILDSLKFKAKMAADLLNSIEGITCNPVQGAMYAFPRLHLPERAIEAANKRGLAADVLYGFELLEETGILIVPGSEFGQVPGTYHFRTTILPNPDKLKFMLERLGEFHKKFLEKYS